MRIAEITRNTNETKIKLSVNLDGDAKNSAIDTGVGFLDHMLTLFAYHGSFEFNLKCAGDTHVDFHHTVEDVAIVLGQAILKALGDKSGITRYGSMFLPMDEALAQVALDISGRPFFVWDVDFVNKRIGDFDTELGEEFFRALSFNAGITLHVRMISGNNSHHILEAIFKGVARALKEAIKVQEGEKDIPSTKGIL